MGQDVEDEPERRRWARWAALVTRVEIGLAAAALVLVFLLVFVQAAQRYLPVAGWAWTGELARFCLVWLTVTVAGVLVTSDGHIALQLVDSIRNPAVLRAVRVFASLTVAAVGAAFAVEAWDLIVSQGMVKSPSLRMPLSWLYVLPFLGFLSTAVRGVAAAVGFARSAQPPAAAGEVRG
ncbi:TRAP transporter small permease [Pseudonocardia zijingensis]|jgi:TRAP-type C4-dicarboxylate transport system permease small subunit|uniref:Tripartite ATP-independent periplasmic transporters DctQ component domain-containing protein n=1 Tax=Pseudonocardia zijingensis TaxID=153376 RepID=A0ABN1NEP5_9PSEU